MFMSLNNGHKMSISEQTKIRRFDLDWLRVILIFMVFLHHVAMPFNGDKFHIMNSDSSKFLDDLMVFFEQFRLPLLFLISGVGTVLASSKRTSFQYFKERSKRLVLPLVFGVFFIVPPQIYIEHIANYSDYFDLYPEAFTNFEMNHLWFLETLYMLSLFAIPVMIFLKSSYSNSIILKFESFTAKKYGLLSMVILLILSNYFFRPNGETGQNDFSKFMYHFYFFFMGILIASGKQIWTNIKIQRRLHFHAFTLITFLFYSYYYMPRVTLTFLSQETKWIIWHVLCQSLAWVSILTVVGYGQVYLSKSYKYLSVLNEGIYPFYIFHQTSIILCAYFIVQWDLGIFMKLLILGISSFILTVILYRFLVYPFNIVRPFFGMKQKRRKIL